LVDGKFLIYSEKGELILAKADPKGYEELGRTHNLGGTCWTPPVLANGRIYLRNSKGKIVCLDARLK
jgi:outer membrane protein assembly factor BamB